MIVTMTMARTTYQTSTTASILGSQTTHLTTQILQNVLGLYWIMIPYLNVHGGKESVLLR